LGDHLDRFAQEPCSQFVATHIRAKVDCVRRRQIEMCGADAILLRISDEQSKILLKVPGPSDARIAPCMEAHTVPDVIGGRLPAPVRCPKRAEALNVDGGCS
jgi:hypothetical protein